MRRAVVNLVSTRPVWALPAEGLASIRESFGGGWDVYAVTEPVSSDGDGYGASSEAVNAAEGAEVYFGFGVAGEIAEAAKSSLRWAHSAATGVSGSLTESFRATGAVLTNSRGIHAEPVADWVVMAIGFCVKGVHNSVTAQRAGAWVKDDFTDGSIAVKEFSDTRVGIVGLGGVGRAVARRCRALEMSVSGVCRHVPEAGTEGFDWLGSGAEIMTLAARSDVLVVSAALTAETYGLVSSDVLAAMPDGAYVVNVSRGDLIDGAALLRELDSGRLACVLDVFSQEPLPEDHPFWAHPRVLMTPHMSAVSSRFWEREIKLIKTNVERYLSGTELMNQVDLKLGY